MNSPEKSCRFCLKEISDNGFKNLEQKAKDILNALNLKVNLDVSEEPVACIDCAESIQKLYTFKVTCTEAKNRLIPFVNPQTNMKSSLSEVHLKMNKEANVKDRNICMLCMCETSREFFIQLNMLIEAKLSLIKMIENMFSKENSNLIGDPMICKNCHDFLLDYLTFSTKCINIEENIQEYVEVEGLNTKEKVNLRNVQQFFKRNGIKKEIDDTDMNRHGMHEEYCGFMNDIPLKVDIKNESHMQVEDLQLNIKSERMELDLTERYSESVLDFASDMVTGMKKEDEELLQMDEICVSSGSTTHRREEGDYSNETNIKSELNQQTLTLQNAPKIRMYKCGYKTCTFETRHKGSLSKHILIHKDTSEVTMYKCEIDGCSYETKHKGKLTRHALVHKNTSEVTMYRCEYEDCLYQTREKSNFARHILIHKNPAEVTMYRCESNGCSYETKFKFHLGAHMLIHKNPSEVTMHTCDFENCSFETKRKSTLWVHKLIHRDPSDVRVYKCGHENCTYETKHKWQLKNHILVHKSPSKEIMYKCDNENCMYESKDRSNFNRHKLVHKNSSEVTMYKCKNENCSYKTKFKSHLKYHVIIHKSCTEVRMYKCEYKGCMFETKHRYSLRKHKLLHMKT